MGFSISYESTKPILRPRQQEIIDAAKQLNSGRTWLSCEPLHFSDVNGRLWGASKLNFWPDPRDAASARAERLPDGTVWHLLRGLCKLSRQFEIDWEISYDDSDGPVGYIRNGTCDREVRHAIKVFGLMCSVVAWAGWLKRWWWLVLIPLAILAWGKQLRAIWQNWGL